MLHKLRLGVVFLAITIIGVLDGAEVLALVACLAVYLMTLDQLECALFLCAVRTVCELAADLNIFFHNLKQVSVYLVFLLVLLTDTSIEIFELCFDGTIYTEMV